MSNNRKILSVILALILALSVIPAMPLSVSAGGSWRPPTVHEYNGFRYVYDDFTGTTIQEYTGDDTDIVIPDRIGERYVDTIGYGAFSDSNLKSITLPEHLERISSGAFKNCTGLTEITIPASVEEISSAFIGCAGLRSIKVDKNNPVYDSRDNCNAIIRTEDNTLVSGCAHSTIPETVTRIGDYAFMDCTGLTEIVIPNSVTEIGDYAFMDCTDLTKIELPNAVTEIGYRAFSGCTGLTEIVIPNSVTSIGNYAFEGCTGLKSISISDSVTRLQDGVFMNCTGLTEIRIPDSVKYIGDWDSLEYRGAFEGCTGLTEITIPDSVTSIGDYTFKDCTGLKSVLIPDSVTEIDYGAFKNCTGLTEITIPASVNDIGSTAFAGCSNLQSVTVDENNPTYDSRDNCNAIIRTEDNTLVSGLAHSTIPETVTRIGNSAFANCTGLTEITIPNSVTEIGGYAFENCTDLTKIEIPNSVTKLNDGTFMNCTGLNEIVIPDSVTEISDGVAYDPDDHGDYESAFTGCTALQSIKVAEGNPVYDSRDNCNAIIRTKDNTLILGCAQTIIPDTVTEIGKSAFEGCSALTEIEIPNSVTEIGNDAFFGCTGLKSVSISDSVTKLNAGVFMNCTGLTEITIPDSVTEINDIWYDYGKQNGAFEGCTGLTEITIPDSVTIIGHYAFEGCTGLKSLLIPDTVTHIGGFAFSGCTGLASITFSDTAVDLGYGAFENCTGLERAVIPESITYYDMKYAQLGITLVYMIGGTEWSEPQKYPDSKLTIYGYYGTDAEAYAADCDIPFRMIAPATSDEVTLDAPEGKTYSVVSKATSDEATSDEATPDTQKLPEGSVVLSAYDITLRDIKDETPVQPDAPVTVRIRCDKPYAHVFRRETDGTLTDMHARYEDGYLVFETDHFSVYLVVQLSENTDALLGDANGDGEISIIDTTIIQRYLAQLKYEPDAAVIEYNGDVDGNGKIDIIDATLIQRYMAGLTTRYPIGEKM